jgi:hypothetical protein
VLGFFYIQRYAPVTEADSATTLSHASVMDDQTYQFACALLAARQVDRDLAEMICEQCHAGTISFDRAIESLQLLVSEHAHRHG